jgi:hypothetical protein
VSRQSIYWPQPVRVKMESDGQPTAVDSVAVDAVREEWLVEDRWWTPKPLSRRYFELVLADGRNVVVFREQVMEGARWHGSDRDATGGSDATMPCPDGGDRWFLQRA